MPTEVQEDISTLTMVRDNLKKQIGELNIKLSNIQSSLQGEEIRKESDRKLAELQEKKKVIIAENSTNNKLDKLVSMQYALDQERQRFNEQLAVLHKREQEFVDLEERRKKLNEERNTFNNYKINILKELDLAKETIEEAKMVQNEIKADRENLMAREKALRKKLDEFDEAMGVFIKEKRDWEIAKNSELIPL